MMIAASGNRGDVRAGRHHRIHPIAVTPTTPFSTTQLCSRLSTMNIRHLPGAGCQVPGARCQWPGASGQVPAQPSPKQHEAGPFRGNIGER